MEKEMIGISAALIAWNEVQSIDLCIKSLVGFVDEIIIADSGSFDGTIEKASRTMREAKIPGRVIRVKTHTLGESRIKAIENCGNRWVFMSDANVIISRALRRELVLCKKDDKIGAFRSLNLMGDYEHAFTPLAFHDPHKSLFHKDHVIWPKKGDRPIVPKNRRHLIRKTENWAVNLSRVRPAWRYWYRGEPFDPKFSKNRQWRTQSNRQYQWLQQAEHLNLIDFVEETEGLSLKDVKRIAPAWYLEMLQKFAKPINKETRRKLPEVIRRELRNPRYKLVYEEDKIVGRIPEL